MGKEKAYRPCDRISKARDLAKEKHEGQFRESGEIYFSHCDAVYKKLIIWGIKDSDTLCAAYLHDSVEDGKIKLEDIREMFGENVADLVDGVTKIKSDTDKQAVEKVFDKSELKPSVALIKLADRLHNMETLEYMSSEKQVKKALETLNVYVPLAESLGIWEVKRKLEDLCFKYIKPNAYKKTKNIIENDPRYSKTFQSIVIDNIQQVLIKCGYIDTNIEVKENSLWSLKQKLEELELNDYKKINDVLSFRVILPTIDDFYTMLETFDTKEGKKIDFDKIKRYIGENKQINGYQAIQIGVDYPEGPIEIAFVTKKMEDFNNWGIISLIKNGAKDKDLTEYFLTPVFTYWGEVRFLPKGSTATDFIHNPRKIAEAKYVLIDGKKSPLSTILPPNSTIQIVYGRPRRAPKDAINMMKNCRLPETRKKIEKLLEQEKRDEIVSRGKKIMRGILSSRGLLNLNDLIELDETKANRIIYNFGQDKNNLYYKLGNKIIEIDKINEILDKLKITKKDLKYTTIELTGKDKPGLMKSILSKIDKNIIFVYNHSNTKKGTFYSRYIVSGLNEAEEQELKNSFDNDPRFDIKTIV